MSKRVLITGASGGLGRAAVEAFAAAGYQVVAGMRGGAEHPLAQTWQAAWPSLTLVDLHLDRRETFAAAVAAAEGGLDLLINNAGYGLLGPTELHSGEAIAQLMNVNVTGTIALTGALLPALRQRRGRVITVGSILGEVTLPYYGLYAASKAALRAWTEGLRYELRPFGVQATILQPGGFRTAFLQRALQVTHPNAPLAYQTRFEGLMHNLERMQHQGGEPARVAERLLALARRRRLPPTSYLGPDAHALRALQVLVPGVVFRAVAGWIFERLLLRAPAVNGRVPMSLPEGNAR